MRSLCTTTREQPSLSAARRKPVQQEDPAQLQTKRKRSGKSRCKIFYLYLSIFSDIIAANTVVAGNKKAALFQI